MRIEDLDGRTRLAGDCPHSRGGRRGRPASGHDCAREPFQWAVPLSDPLGGTGANNGRHMAKMAEIRKQLPDHRTQSAAAPASPVEVFM